MDAKPHELLAREFLADHPEFIPDYRFADVDGRRELLVTEAAARAFGDWAARKGYTTEKKVRAGKQRLDDAIRKAFGGEDR